jgi:hypothetical protein
MKTLKANPGAKRLIESLRNMGYECSTAIADLVDNSIAAHASEVHIEILAQHASDPAAVVIADNGRGMDRDQLYEAMRFGAFQEYAVDDLGKYGLGLKTASLSQCRNLTVSSKAKPSKGSRPRRAYMRWDLDYVYRTDDWDLLAPTADELDAFEAQALTHEASADNGTVVLWTGLAEALPLLSTHDVRQRERFLARLITEVSDHLRMVFHRFIQGTVTGRRKLNIYVGGQKIQPWDPFCRSEDTRELDIVRLPVVIGGTETTADVTVTPFILPREDEFSTQAAWRAASGPRNWNQQQGFYFYRNNRLLQAGGWSWLRAVDEHTKLLRVAVDFSRDLDRAFAINVTKMRARVPAEIRDHVAAAVSKWVKPARERYDGRSPGAKKSGGAAPRTSSSPAKAPDAPSVITVGPVSFTRSNAPSHSLSVVPGGKAGQIRIIVPQSHEFAGIFDAGNGQDADVRKLCLTALSVLEAVFERRMRADAIPIEALRRVAKKLL